MIDSWVSLFKISSFGNDMDFVSQKRETPRCSCVFFKNLQKILSFYSLHNLTNFVPKKTDSAFFTVFFFCDRLLGPWIFIRWSKWRSGEFNIDLMVYCLESTRTHSHSRATMFCEDDQATCSLTEKCKLSPPM